MATHLDRVKEKTRGKRTTGTFEGTRKESEQRNREQSEMLRRVERAPHSMALERRSREAAREAAELAEYKKRRGTGNAQGGGSKAGAATNNENTKDLLRREFYRGN